MALEPIEETAVLSVIDAEAEAARAADEARRVREQDEALLVKWQQRFAQALSHDSDARERYADDRKYARGETEWLVDTNLIGAIIEILMAFIYAKDPDVSVRPSPAVGQSRLQQYSMVAKTMEVVLSRMLKQAGLKRQAKRWVRSAMTIGIGWMTAGLQTRMERDPIAEKQINDLRANLARIEQIEGTLARGDAADEDVEKANLRNQIVALEANLERMVADGAVIDFRSGEDVVVSPECGELENYLASPWIAYVNYKPKDEARALTDWPDDDESAEDFKSANVYTQRQRHGEDGGGGPAPTSQYVLATNDSSTQSPDGFVRVIEAWSLTDGLVYTWIDGVKRWARKPYAPITGARFYNCFQLAFHYVDSERHPQSDVKLLKKLQDEFGRTRSNFAEHRRRAIPATLFDETQIDSATMRKIKDNEQQEYIGVSTTNGTPMGNAFFPKPYAQVDPALYTTDPIRVDMEKVSGAQDAQQGSVAVEKTLGEAEIQQSGFMARTGARRDQMEDVLSELVEYLAQVSLQVLDSNDAQRYAGRDAVWAKLSVDEALSMFDIEVKAGSTGKPRNSMDKQTWGTIMPLMQQMIDRVGQARIKGEEWAAKPWIALLRETALRLDDRIDVDAMLPVPPPPPPMPPMGEGGNPMEAIMSAIGGGAAPPSEAAPDPGALAPSPVM